MNILILGSGGREHALAWKIKQSSKCENLYVAPGNGGTSEIASNLTIGVNDFEGIKEAIRNHDIHLLIVGPEDPLVNGIVDELEAEFSKLMIIGPGLEGAKLEGSKDYAKQFMNRHKIPTAKSKVFDKKSIKKGYKFLESLEAPYVLKADGLAAGKGVIITEDLDEAKAGLDDLLINERFGEASESVLIEEYLRGIELSVFVVTDGDHYVILPEAKDYKRIGENDTGPNTGGMGSVSPVVFADRVFMQKVEDRIVIPTIKGLKKDGIKYKGFIFIGLMSVNLDPFVIEYNVRMGDPETQVVLPRIKNDLVELLEDTALGKLEKHKILLEPFTATTVIMASGGYPGDYEKGKEIEFKKELMKGVIVFHAGTALEDNKLVTNGGRVLALTGLGKNMGEALNKSYDGSKGTNFEGMQFRKDIGEDLARVGQSLF